MNHFYTIKTALVCLLVFFFSTLSTTLTAQNWHPLPSNSALLYSFSQQGSTDEWYFAAKADSVRLEGADMAYYLYRIDRLALPSDRLVTCSGDSLSAIPGSVAIGMDHYLGQKMLLRPQGECVFVSSQADSFLLQTLAQIGQSWVWKPGVIATVDSMVLGSVLGVADSLKYISLSTGKSIVLSKDHGMVHCFAFLPFPNWQNQLEDVDFSIWGLPGQGLGGHFPDFEEIYDLDVGDRFGLYQEIIYPTGRTESWVEQVIYSIQPGSCLQYLATMEQVFKSTQVGNTYHPPAPITIGCDSNHYALISLLPYETHLPSTNFDSEYFQNGMRHFAGSMGRMRLDFMRQTMLDSCANAYAAIEGVWKLSFATGLRSISSSFSDAGHSSHSEMYCYQKGTESWGTCVNLSTMLTGVESPSQATFELSPNPASNQVRIQLAEPSAAPLQITLLNLSGQVVATEMMRARQGVIDLAINVFPSGMYLLEMTDGKRGFEHRKLVIAR